MSEGANLVRVIIPLTQGYRTVVDADDADLAAYCWKAEVGKVGDVYAVRNQRVDGSWITHRMHRVIFERAFGITLTREQEVDHIDGNSLNNTRGNLRAATRAENMRNHKRYRNNTSGVTGVSWHSRRNQWAAYIKNNGRSTHLGYFDNLDAAREARQRAELELFGSFSPLRPIIPAASPSF